MSGDGGGHAFAEDSLSGRRRLDLDPVGRVTGVRAAGWTERYAYDIAGNLTHAGVDGSAVPTKGQGERKYSGTLIRRAGDIRYEHDRAGRMTLRQEKQRSTKPWTWRYSWDSEDRLIAVITPDGTHWRYRYDGLSRRIAKQRLAADGSTVEEQVDFTWDDMFLVEQVHRRPGDDGAAARITTWDYEPGEFTPIIQNEQAIDRNEVERRFYAIVADLTGAPSELVTPDGRIAWQLRTTIWGTPTHVASDGTDCPLRFPGQYHDAETGASYNYRRYYDPATARYQSTDPLGLEPGPDPHAYVPNPTREIDPLGLGSYGKWMAPLDFAKAEARDVRNLYRTMKGATETGQHGAGLKAAANELRRRVRESGFLPEVNEELLATAKRWEDRARGIDHGMMKGR